MYFVITVVHVHHTFKIINPLHERGSSLKNQQSLSQSRKYQFLCNTLVYLTFSMQTQDWSHKILQMCLVPYLNTFSTAQYPPLQRMTVLYSHKRRHSAICYQQQLLRVSGTRCYCLWLRSTHHRLRQISVNVLLRMQPSYQQGPENRLTLWDTASAGSTLQRAANCQYQ